MLLLLTASFLPQQPPAAPPAPPAPITVALAPAAADAIGGPRWSPKGATVSLTLEKGALVGAIALGPQGTPAIAVSLQKSEGAAQFDRLWVDHDRDVAADADEELKTTPKETRGKWWSSFETVLSIPVPATAAAPATTRPYPVSLWFVKDPLEPDAKPALRWSRRGWHLGQCELGGKPAFVQQSEMQMDGVFDQRDAWAIARTQEGLAKAATRSLEQHCWLDGVAYRPVAIDAHGRSLAFEAFDPGHTEAEEAAKADVQKPDREAPRAGKPVAFGHELAAALAAAKRDGKRVFVDFETTWCGPCKQMDQWVYTAAAVVAAAEGMPCVKLDGDERRDLVKQYAVSGYPTMLLLDGDGKEVKRAVGYRSVAAMVEFLR